MSEVISCSAHTSAGNACKRSPMKGTTVCASHGGSAPQVRRRAQERILAAADPAAAKLVGLLSGKHVPYNVQLAAAKDLLDRAGLHSPQEVLLQVRKYEEILDEVIVDADVVDDSVNALPRRWEQP